MKPYYSITPLLAALLSGLSKVVQGEKLIRRPGRSHL